MKVCAVLDTNILVSALLTKRSDSAVALALEALLSGDVVFYEVALSKEDSFLVTGNTKHFPKTPIVVTPLEFLKKIGKL